MEIPRAFHSSARPFLLVNSPLATLPIRRSNADPVLEGAFSFPLFLPNLRSRTDADSALATRRLPDVREGKLARLGDTGPGYLRVAFRIARICAHTRIRGAWRGQTESNGCKGALTLSHGVLLWPCRVKGTRKLARPSCYVKPKFSLGIGRRRYPLPTAGGRSASGGERGGARLGNASLLNQRATRRGVRPRGGEPPPSLALINSRHGPLSRLCRPSARSRPAVRPRDRVPRIKKTLTVGAQ